MYSCTVHVAKPKQIRTQIAIAHRGSGVPGMSAPGAGGETPLFPVASIRWGRCSRSGGLIDRAFPKCTSQLRSCPTPSPFCRSSGIVRRRSATRRYRHSLDRQRIAAVLHRHWPLKTNGRRLCTHSCGSRGSGASSTWRSGEACSSCTGRRCAGERRGRFGGRRCTRFRPTCVRSIGCWPRRVVIRVAIRGSRRALR